MRRLENANPRAMQVKIPNSKNSKLREISNSKLREAPVLRVRLKVFEFWTLDFEISDPASSYLVSANASVACADALRLPWPLSEHRFG